ncbi:MAG: CDP-alcohol phosphatidyltransferase family protein [Spirochaetota bacterium]
MARSDTANILTSSRFVLAPLFAVVFGLIGRLPGFAPIGVSLLWLIFALIELSDMLDGAVARRSNTVSDVGKLLDPFADVVSKVTYFACFLVAGYLPLWFLLVVLYREFGIILMRMMLYRDGTALAARLAGKLKTWFYALTAAVALFFLSVDVLSGAPLLALGRVWPLWRSIVMVVLLTVTAGLSVGSFLQYATLFRQARSGRSNGEDT